MFVVFRPAVDEHGVPEKIIMDSGLEFQAVCFGQMHHRAAAEIAFVNNGVGRICNRVPFQKVPSTSVSHRVFIPLRGLDSLFAMICLSSTSITRRYWLLLHLESEDRATLVRCKHEC